MGRQRASAQVPHRYRQSAHRRMTSLGAGVSIRYRFFTNFLFSLILTIICPLAFGLAKPFNRCCDFSFCFSHPLFLPSLFCFKNLKTSPIRLLRACRFHRLVWSSQNYPPLRRNAVRLCGSGLHGRYSTRQSSTAWRDCGWHCGFGSCSEKKRSCHFHCKR